MKTKLEAKIVEIALELYKEKFGDADYNLLMELFKDNPKAAKRIFEKFLEENSNYLQEETAVDIISDMIMDE
jgi:hypothetical protein